VSPETTAKSIKGPKVGIISTSAAAPDLKNAEVPTAVIPPTATAPQGPEERLLAGGGPVGMHPALETTQESLDGDATVSDALVGPPPKPIVGLFNESCNESPRSADLTSGLTVSASCSPLVSLVNAPLMALVVTFWASSQVHVP
jgi:hypothetical protein